MFMTYMHKNSVSFISWDLYVQIWIWNLFWKADEKGNLLWWQIFKKIIAFAQAYEKGEINATYNKLK